ncbi:MAG: DUF4367 domain-containing protein [Oscillospiraceae bacterium]|nr:DUF4367 domain-containing protein [Oscillospiraceae bacterium]
MSDNQNRGTVDYTKYEAMTTEELEEILRLDAEMPQGQESDTDTILYIMEVLAERKRNSSHTGKTALEAYESFKSNYMPETDNDTVPEKMPAKTRGRAPCWIRSLTAAAIALVILIAGTVTADAMGFDIWKAVVQWTQETFHFGKEGNSEENDSLSYKSLQEALEKGNAPTWLIPTYIPEEFELINVKVEQTPAKKVYRGQYANGEKSLKITVQDFLDKDPVYVEQSEGLVEEYNYFGTTYYLFENNGQVRAAWTVDSYECYITGDVTIDDLKMMINSIERG